MTHPHSVHRVNRRGCFVRAIVLVGLLGTAIGAFSAGAPTGKTQSPKAGPDGTITINFASPQGTIRALHGVNGGPVDVGGLFDMSSHWKELAIPCARLNPWAMPDPYVVDIPLIFPLFHLDPDKPEHYLFARTDDFIAAILKTQAQIIYRLGTTIEHTTRKYHTQPPGDFDKWARISVNIIRHYNEGWADGFHHGIRYWEIWNEPDMGPLMWTGTQAEFFRLYETASRAIKKHDPQLKVGGPALANVNSDYMEKFLSFCQERSLPLDFFSWHTYAANPATLQSNAKLVREALDRHGFKSTESHLNEWHYITSRDFWNKKKDPARARKLFEQINGPEGAAFAASSLILFQDMSVDVANYYTADTLRWGLFANFGVPNKCFYAFKAFRQLLDTPRRVHCEASDAASGLAACAGLSGDGKSATLLVSNFKNAAHRFTIRLDHLPWPGSTVVETWALDAEHDLNLLDRETRPAGDLALSSDCPSPAVRVLRFTPAP